MKILVTYFSQTGNTEKIANAIYEEVRQENDVEINMLHNITPDSFGKYDCVFIGAPIHAGNIAKDVDVFLKKIHETENTILAGFVTHAAPAYPRQSLDKMAAPFEKACKDNGMEYKGCFNCQGYLADAMHEMVQKMQKIDDATWAENIKQMTGHPNTEDEAKAKAFARGVLS